jgi:hypothetical protein
MTIELWIGKEFDTSYEREVLDSFLTDMQSRFGNTDTLYLILADYCLDGRQIDLTILKHDAVIVVELKNCQEPFKASENGDWLTPSGYLLGSKERNPLQQTQQYRVKWVNFLKRNKHNFRCLVNAQDDRPFWNVTGVVAINPSLHPHTDNKISNDSWWFKLRGVDDLIKTIEFQTNQWMNFSDEELRKLAGELLSLKFNPKIKNISRQSYEQIGSNLGATSHRALIAGMTDYSHQSFRDIVRDLEHWVTSLNEVRNYLKANLRKLEESGYWETVIFELKAIFQYAIKFYDTSIKEINEILSEIQVEVQSHHISRLRRLSECAVNLNIEYGRIWHQEYIDKDYGEQNFMILENMYAEGRQMAVDMLDLSRAVERLTDFVGKK